MSRLPHPVPVKLVPLDHPRIEDMLNRATREFMGTLQQVLMTQATHTRQETKQLVAQGAAIEAELVQPVHPAADQALVVMRELITGINSGTSLELLYPKLQRLISNQERRAEIVDQLALTSDFDRLATLAQARAHLEHELISSAYRDELTTGERMALLDAIVPLEREVRNRVRSGATAINDLLANIQRMESALAIDEEALRNKFSKTTPQGREVVRKLAMRLGKATRPQ